MEKYPKASWEVNRTRADWGTDSNEAAAHESRASMRWVYASVRARIWSAAPGAASSSAAPMLATWMAAFFGLVHTWGSKRNSGASSPSSGGNGQGATSTARWPLLIV